MARPIFNLRSLRDRLAPFGEAVRPDVLQTVQRAIETATASLPPGHAASGLIESVLARALPGFTARHADAAPAGDAADADGHFTRGSFTGEAGTRPYRLFVPRLAGGNARAPALIVMLHGCTQTAEDFAAGTAMNRLAAEAGALVLYPVQVAGANAQRCWNWFNPADQQREGGEAALIAAMTRSVIAAHNIDPKRVFVAGLSAGGAQAAILGATYPDLFAAVGVHSGLACGAAADVSTAFAAMRGGREGRGRHRMRTIIFHGDRDSTVNPSNADAVADQVAGTASGAVQTETGVSKGGVKYTRTVQRDASGRPAIERWTVHGAGHAWSGGNSAGSFTDPRGPDASGAMLAFFLGS
jgi:poly(hydroxyalkanoate) depolymerase family esterase